MNPEHEHDPLAELLGGNQLPPVNPGQRDAIFAQTRGVLRRRRLLRRMSFVGTLASCWALGVFSVLAWQAVQRQERVATRPGDDTNEIKIPMPTEVPTAPADGMPGPSDSSHSSDVAPHAIARSESVDALTTFEKMRRAGDRQLNEFGNLRGAIGCYRRALDFASDDDLQIVPERDSWLLIPLKEAKLEIRKNVHKKS